MNQKTYSDQELKGKWYLMRHCPENCEAGKKAVHLRVSVGSREDGGTEPRTS